MLPRSPEAEEPEYRCLRRTRMSLWVDSLTLAGLTCVTFGTGAQALASRADFMVLVQRRNDEAAATLEQYGDRQFLDPPGPISDGIVAWLLSERSANHIAASAQTAYRAVSVGISCLWIYFRWHAVIQHFITEADSGTERRSRFFWDTIPTDDEIGTFRLIRQTAIWTVLCLGSALVWIGALIALIHDAA
jgi:hypothetical protein